VSNAADSWDVETPTERPTLEFPGWARPLFNKHPRYRVLYGGRGSGKSWAAARALLVIAAERQVRVLCAREIQRSIRDSVHRLLCDQIEAMGFGPGFVVTDAEIRHRVTGSLFVFSGLAQHTVESIKSFEGIDICWVEEAQTVTARSWDVLTPTIRKKGSQIWLTLNPDMDTDETYVRFIEQPPPDAWVHYANWDTNQWFGEELEKERQATLRRDPVGYENIWEGKPKRVADEAIYRYEMTRVYEDHRVRPVPYDPLLKVHTVWDLGYADSMAIGMWQRQGAEVRCIDYIEDSYRTLDWYVSEIEHRPFRWGSDFIPHDGRARDFKTGKSTEEHLVAMHRKPVVLPQMSVEEGIKAARLMLPRVWFDETKCAPLLEHMKRYQRSIGLVTHEPGAPLHDAHSHGADMVRYAAMAVEMMGNADSAEPIEYRKRYIA
jgi:phage terminase large subunit